MLRLLIAASLINVIFSSSGDSCVNRCDDPLDSSKPCQCNHHCERFKDCCTDYHSVCKGGSCVGRCDASYDSSQPCQCNSQCSHYGNCCSDIHLCSGDGSNTNSPSIFQELWDADTNKLTSTDYGLNLQGKTTEHSVEDLAPGHLFSSIDSNIFHNRPTFAAFIQLLDNYNIHTGQVEDLTPAEWKEIEHFLDTVLSTTVMTKAYQYLHDKGHVSSMDNFRDTLKELWFNLYARSTHGPVDSSGFEHVMTGELKSTSVTGFHNWIQFYYEEKHENINYMGYIDQKQPSLLAVHFTWHGLWKHLGSFFVGTSPEFDMAVFSICALTHPNAICSFIIDGHSVKIQTWDVAHKTGAQIASSYPVA